MHSFYVFFYVGPVWITKDLIGVDIRLNKISRSFHRRQSIALRSERRSFTNATILNVCECLNNCTDILLLLKLAGSILCSDVNFGNATDGPGLVGAYLNGIVAVGMWEWKGLLKTMDKIL